MQYRLHPYMMAELGVGLDTAMRQGLLPVVRAAGDPDAVLKAYNGLYLREEVQMEGLPHPPTSRHFIPNRFQDEPLAET